MTEHVCPICKVRFDAGGARLYCDECNAHVTDIVARKGYSTKNPVIRTAITKMVREHNWEYTESEFPVHTRGRKTKVEKTPKVAVTGDVLATYLGLVQKWRESETNGVTEKQQVDRDAEKLKADIDARTAIHKQKLDSFTRTNAVKLEPILQAMAQPLIDARNIEKQREADKVAAEQAAARRAEIAKEMRDTA